MYRAAGRPERGPTAASTCSYHCLVHRQPVLPRALLCRAQPPDCHNLDLRLHAGYPQPSQCCSHSATPATHPCAPWTAVLPCTQPILEQRHTKGSGWVAGLPGGLAGSMAIPGAVAAVFGLIGTCGGIFAMHYRRLNCCRLFASHCM